MDFIPAKTHLLGLEGIVEPTEEDLALLGLEEFDLDDTWDPSRYLMIRPADTYVHFLDREARFMIPGDVELDAWDDVQDPLTYMLHLVVYKYNVEMDWEEKAIVTGYEPAGLQQGYDALLAFERLRNNPTITGIVSKAADEVVAAQRRIYREAATQIDTHVNLLARTNRDS